MSESYYDVLIKKWKPMVIEKRKIVTKNSPSNLSDKYFSLVHEEIGVEFKLKKSYEQLSPYMQGVADSILTFMVVFHWEQVCSTFDPLYEENWVAFLNKKGENG